MGIEQYRERKNQFKSLDEVELDVDYIRELKTIDEFKSHNGSHPTVTTVTCAGKFEEAFRKMLIRKSLSPVLPYEYWELHDALMVRVKNNIFYKHV